MAILKAFKGIRPKKDLVQNIACRPYDVLNEQEARIETMVILFLFPRYIKNKKSIL